MRNFLRVTVRIVVIIFAIIGFVFTSVFVAMQFDLLNVPGNSKDRNQFFLDAAKEIRQSASVVSIATSTAIITPQMATTTPSAPTPQELPDTPCIDPQKTIRLKGAVVLGRLGQKDPSVYPRVAPNLASKDKDVLLGTLRALGGMGGIAEPSLPQMVYFLEESSDPDLRNEASESLIKMGTTASQAAAERYTKGQYDRRSAP